MEMGPDLLKLLEEIEQPLEEGKLKDFALGHGYFDDSGEGKRKRADKNWLSKQAGSKKTIPHPKKKKLVSDRKVAEENLDEVSDTLKKNYIKKANKEITSSEKRISDLDRDEGPHTVGSRGADNADLRDIHQKGIDKRRKGVVKARSKLKEETETETREKMPNEKVRALHNTVRDVLSPDPLVVDPNYELQKETDRLYNDVQEGAKQDAMRDIKADSGKGMAPLKKDPTKSKHDGSEQKGPEHIVSQMRKAVSLGDKHDGVKFKDGKTHKVSSAHAHKFLNKYMNSKPADKSKMQDHAHASHDNFKTHVDK